jgi:O-antigen/teichoic acid export membrane protein
MQDSEVLEIKGKLISGVFALTSRTFILQIIAIVSTGILTYLLSPSAFGVFTVVSAVISFLTYFSDIGFAAALIQKKEEPTREELVTVFTIQTLMVGGVVLLALAGSHYIIEFYKLETEGQVLFDALLISFFISSLKTIPSVLLERKLDFKLLVVPQIFETLVFYIIAIVAAYMGKGIESYAWAALARGVIGLILIYIISPWRISFGFSKNAAKHLLKFGVPFQLNSFLALVKDDLMTIFLGKILPFSQVGYIGWAKKWAEAPLRLIMDNIIRVTFPAYSRLQSDKKLLASAIEKSMFFLALFTFPATILMISIVHPLIDLIPKYGKWQPALIAFYFFAVSTLFSTFSSPIINALNAVGKIRSTLIMMIVWTILTWTLIPALVFKVGFTGVAVAAFFISFTGVIPVIMLRKILYINILPPIIRPFQFSIVMAIIILIGAYFATSLPIFAGVVVIAGLVYVACVWIWLRQELKPYTPKFFHSYMS